MAITAVLTVTPSTVTAAQVATVSCVISNSGATTTVTGIAPMALNPAGAATTGALLGQPPVGPVVITVPGSGSVTVTWPVSSTTPVWTTYPVSPFPVGVVILGSLAMPQQLVLTLAAVVYTADGSVTAASTAALTVNGPTVG